MTTTMSNMVLDQQGAAKASLANVTAQTQLMLTQGSAWHYVKMGNLEVRLQLTCLSW